MFEIKINAKYEVNISNCVALLPPSLPHTLAVAPSYQFYVIEVYIFHFVLRSYGSLLMVIISMYKVDPLHSINAYEN